VSVICLICTISPPSGPVVGPPKLLHSDQLQIHPGVGVRVMESGVMEVGEIVKELAVDVTEIVVMLV